MQQQSEPLSVTATDAVAATVAAADTITITAIATTTIAATVTSYVQTVASRDSLLLGFPIWVIGE